MSPRSIRRAAERSQQKLLRKQNRALAMAARPDEPAGFNEANIPENDPAGRRQQKLARKAARQLENEPSAIPSTEPRSPKPRGACSNGTQEKPAFDSAGFGFEFSTAHEPAIPVHPLTA